jgi:hypothetical protein
LHGGSCRLQAYLIAIASFQYRCSHFCRHSASSFFIY